ncbi:MAG: hypothetical protein EOO85_29850, partial [Pedobacter sp.]
MKKIFSIVLLAFVLTYSFNLKAQTVPVGTTIEDYYRRLQLLGQLDSSISFTNRPITAEAIKKDNIFDPEEQLLREGWLKKSGPVHFAKGKGTFQILPFSWQQQFNSHHPFGWNDGPMIPSKGYQTLVSGGFFAKIGPLSIQLKPEYVFAQNAKFESYGENRNDTELGAYYGGNNNYIDNPERYGNNSYSKLGWGQSSIRLTVGPASVGLSNENIWWGPGLRNSLMMSNNASGFKHATLNTVRPVKTYIGSFEGQIIGGRLESSGFSPLENTTLSSGTVVYDKPREDWRYLAGLNISYQPKWVPGLFLGFTRTFMSYGSDLNKLADYVPFFIP